MYAFCARYGHQPLSELRELTMRELSMFYTNLAELVAKEPAFTLK